MKRRTIRRSRYINERAHANIQKDGTYSVIPRMWGGETTADELRRIADVVDKYPIPTVKVTGGQRIDLLGVKKEDLPAVWKDLGMPSRPCLCQGAAHREDLRRQRVVPLRHPGLDADGQAAGARAVGACMRRTRSRSRCRVARATAPSRGIKDVGVIGVDSRLGDLCRRQWRHQDRGRAILRQAEDARGSAGIRGAFLQLYREEGWYLERTVHYLGRVGLDHVKKRMLEDADEPQGVV